MCTPRIAVTAFSYNVYNNTTRPGSSSKLYLTPSGMSQHLNIRCSKLLYHQHETRRHDANANTACHDGSHQAKPEARRTKPGPQFYSNVGTIVTPSHSSWIPAVTDILESDAPFAAQRPDGDSVASSVHVHRKKQSNSKENPRQKNILTAFMAPAIYAPESYRS